MKSENQINLNHKLLVNKYTEIGKINKKTFMLFSNIIVFDTYKNPLQSKFDDDDDVVFTGYLIEFHDFLFEKGKRGDYGIVSGFF